VLYSHLLASTCISKQRICVLAYCSLQFDCRPTNAVHGLCISGWQCSAARLVEYTTHLAQFTDIVHALPRSIYAEQWPNVYSIKPGFHPNANRLRCVRCVWMETGL